MVGTIIIIFFYDPVFAVIVIACVAPAIFVTRFGANAINKFGARYQKAKGEMSNIGTESWQNIRTVKAFAEEEMAWLKFALEADRVFEFGRVTGYYWAIFFLGYRVLSASCDLLIVYILS